MESWKDIPSTEGRYQVSNLGRIKRNTYTRTNSNKTTLWEQTYPEKILSGQLDSHGYLQVTLPILGARLVHRLVAIMFLPMPSERLVEECLKGGHKVVLVNHKDKNPLNNEVSNLEWCTPAYNNDYSSQDYTYRSGSLAKQALLTEDDIDAILSLKGKRSQQDIAEMFGVKQITISNIYTGRSWSNYTGIPRKERNKGKSQAKTIVIVDEA